MSDNTYVFDNQFIAINHDKDKSSYINQDSVDTKKENRPILDYQAFINNIKKPATPEQRYLEGFVNKKSASLNKSSLTVKTVFKEIPVKTKPEQYFDLPLKEHNFHNPLLTHDFFQLLLSEIKQNDTSIFGRLRSFLRIPRLNKIQIALTVIAIIFISFGTYLTIAGWQSYNVVKKQAASLTTMANKLSKNTNDTKNSTGAISTTPINHQTLADYVVAPNRPRYIIIPKLNVDARVLSVGVTSTGALGTPYNVFDTAWYNQSALPGQQGAMLIDGHVSSWTAHGVFYGLHTLVAGDIIKIVRGDGTVFTYKVITKKFYPANKVNMQAAMTPIVSGQPGLNLITCTGHVYPGTSLFNERVVVFATQISS